MAVMQCGSLLPLTVALVQSFSFAAATQLQIPSFSSFLRRYRRAYSHGTREYEDRQLLFNQRAAEVLRLNARQDRRWTAGINSLSDRTTGELKQLRGWSGGASANSAGKGGGRASLMLSQKDRALPLPEEFTNWTSLESVRHVKNQGGCGSCWAIAAATVLQSHSEIHQPPLKRRTFSVQELVSCVQNPHSCGGDGGCEGATVELAFDHALRLGVSQESAVPYTGVTGRCHQAAVSQFNQFLGKKGSADKTTDRIAAPGSHQARAGMAGMAFGMHGWERLPENKYAPLVRAVVEHGPVAISVAASTWGPYVRGVFDHCSKDAVIDHAVVLVGFGNDRALKEKYWHVQNSWGGDWGEQGRIRLLRRESDEDEFCGIDRQPELGTGCKGGPKQVPVCGMCGILYDSAIPLFSS